MARGLSIAHVRARAAQLPAAVVVRTTTKYVSDVRRRHWLARRRLDWLKALTARTRLRIPFGLGAGMWISGAHLDLGGAQTYFVVVGLHEPMVQEALRRTLARGGVFYDVGANIGFMSLVAAALVGVEGQVVAIDPEPSNVAAIRANAAINRLNQVRVVHAAASALTGPIEVLGVSDTLWTRLASVGPHPLQRERFTARGIALDDLISLAGLRPPDVVKIDVEGGELEVLAGMQRLLAQRRTAVVAEMHGKTDAFCALMARAGYAVVNLDGPEPPELAHPNTHLLAYPLVPG